MGNVHHSCCGNEQGPPDIRVEKPVRKSNAMGLTEAMGEQRKLSQTDAQALLEGAAMDDEDTNESSE